jgi:hypothetical protein
VVVRREAQDEANVRRDVETSMLPPTLIQGRPNETYGWWRPARRLPSLISPLTSPPLATGSRHCRLHGDGTTDIITAPLLSTALTASSPAQSRQLQRRPRCRCCASRTIARSR